MGNILAGRGRHLLYLVDCEMFDIDVATLPTPPLANFEFDRTLPKLI
jgi:hypothetical protein